DKPFPGFPGFPPPEMLDKMWDMMRLTPFGAAFPGLSPGTAQGFGSPLAAMSDMMAPLVNIEELDKRITDMRAVEQWLKLNLNMLQSAIQALEVQRATLSTLRAFGAFAQSSMKPGARDELNGNPAPSPWHSAFATTPSSRETDSAASAPADASADEAHREAAAEKEARQAAPEAAPFDPSSWWNMLQSQFNQLASIAMAQPEAAGDAPASGQPGASGKKRAKRASSSSAGASRSASSKATAASSKAAPKRPTAPAAPAAATARKAGARRTGPSSAASSREK
ncbi:MAG TPA: PhaM family polyhydroxyalkanoate granule multifunctional regulatory protein, partial [Trinickia sp.]|nr:PhaM family polyhydroxyalkanoate granule multifunctional regulatory protein [Trinickia sp.]